MCYSGDSVESVAVYFCDDGYTLQGDSTRECLSTDLWNGSTPLCIESDGRPNSYLISIEVHRFPLHLVPNCVAGNSHTTSGTTATVIVGITCSLVFLSTGLLLGVVSIYLIQRARGRLSGPTTGPSPLPLPPAATYEEVGVAGEVKGSHEIQLTSNEAYGHLNKNNIPISPNTAYGQVAVKECRV